MWMYFVESLGSVRAQLSLFGLANYLGAVAYSAMPGTAADIQRLSPA
jgi:hypothetical protein